MHGVLVYFSRSYVRTATYCCSVVALPSTMLWNTFDTLGYEECRRNPLSNLHPSNTKSMCCCIVHRNLPACPARCCSPEPVCCALSMVATKSGKIESNKRSSREFETCWDFDYHDLGCLFVVFIRNRGVKSKHALRFVGVFDIYLCSDTHYYHVPDQLEARDTRRYRVLPVWTRIGAGCAHQQTQRLAKGRGGFLLSRQASVDPCHHNVFK